MKYNNQTNATGIHITEASPIDDRSQISTESEVSVLVNKEPFPGIMYDGMVVQFADTRKSYVWVESDYGLMATGFTYPDWYDDIQGQNYAKKKYNFVLFDKVCDVVVVYTNNTVPGLLVSRDKLPYHILKNMKDAHVVMKSSETSYTETEFPDHIEETAEGLLIILDPKPAVNETFKIKIT